MRAAVFPFTESGALKAGELLGFFKNRGIEAEVHTPDGYAPSGLKDVAAAEFSRCGLLVFIGSLGIAVRAVAPLIRSKAEDPAVVCMDEKAEFVIPVLSGHIGGANRFAEEIAVFFGGTPVITTATEVNGVFAADRWAAEQGLVIADAGKVKMISKALLKGEPVGLCTEYEVKGGLPAGIVISTDASARPFESTLNLLPRTLHLGIGCKRNASRESIEHAVRCAFSGSRLDLRCVRRVASIDLKEREAGLLAFAQGMGVPAAFYSAEDLSGAMGDFSESEFVKGVTGVSNVCERAAVLSSGGGRVVLEKTVVDSVAVAAAESEWSVCFED